MCVMATGSEYLKHATEAKRTELRDALTKMPLALHATVDGAWVACWCVAHGAPKDRKVFVKALKSNVMNLVTHETGFLIVARALNVIDDTVLTRKSVRSAAPPPLCSMPF
jgi:pumilio family protein 6